MATRKPTAAQVASENGAKTLFVLEGHESRIQSIEGILGEVSTKVAECAANVDNLEDKVDALNSSIGSKLEEILAHQRKREEQHEELAKDIQEIKVKEEVRKVEEIANEKRKKIAMGIVIAGAGGGLGKILDLLVGYIG